MNNIYPSSQWALPKQDSTFSPSNETEQAHALERMKLCARTLIWRAVQLPKPLASLSPMQGLRMYQKCFQDLLWHNEFKWFVMNYITGFSWHFCFSHPVSDISFFYNFVHVQLVLLDMKWQKQICTCPIRSFKQYHVMCAPKISEEKAGSNHIKMKLNVIGKKHSHHQSWQAALVHWFLTWRAV